MLHHVSFILTTLTNKMTTMKQSIIICISLLMSTLSVYSQSIEQLFVDGEFDKIKQYVDSLDKLDPRDIFAVGYAFFLTEEEEKAVEIYDKAIEKGYTDEPIYYHKGVALIYAEKYDEAEKNIRIAIEKAPKKQRNYSELGNIYYFQKKYDEALTHYYKARELSYQESRPYIAIPNIYLGQGDDKKALEEAKISASLIDKEDPDYITLLDLIGEEERKSGNYEEAIRVFKKAISLTADNYHPRAELAQTYYMMGEYELGDNIIALFKEKYEAEELPDYYQKNASLQVDEFEVQGRKVIVHKKFKEPEVLDAIFIAYYLDENGEDIERVIATEKTLDLGMKNSPKHFLGERHEGGHRNFGAISYKDDVDYQEFKSATIEVLNKKVTAVAASDTSVSIPKSKDKKKRKKKRKKKKKRKN